MKKYIIIGLLLLAVLFNSEMDTILFKPSQAWFNGWWIASNSQQPFWQKYLLGWTVDGWHFCKMGMLTSFMLAITVSNKLRWYWFLILLFGWGILFEVFYGI